MNTNTLPNKIGFGFMRIPRIGEGKDAPVDLEKLIPLVDAFLDGGGTYFDTAYNYLGGRSETALREALVLRHPRDHFLLADKLPTFKLSCKEDCRKFFDEQLERCGVTFFDRYLLHWLCTENYVLAKQHGAFDFLFSLRESGEAKQIGFSYHGDAALLDEILTAHPGMDFVQLQINYLDWESPSIQSRLCYETARKHGIPISIMGPVKGGLLSSLPEDAESILSNIRPEDTPSRWATRFAASLDGVVTVLSGMNDLSQIADNLRPMQPLTAAETEAIFRARDALQSHVKIACTACSYCVSHCPMQISIPTVFAMYNELIRDQKNDWKVRPAYAALSESSAPAYACIACRACEQNCPQRLPIADLLAEVAEAFEKNT